MVLHDSLRDGYTVESHIAARKIAVLPEALGFEAKGVD